MNVSLQPYQTETDIAVSLIQGFWKARPEDHRVIRRESIYGQEFDIKRYRKGGNA